MSSKTKKSEEKTPINDQIDAREVRLIDAEGKQRGIVSIEEALRLGEESKLDVVEVSGTANPPVCRLMDYGKYKYQLSKKQHAAKKQQKVIHVKEVKLRPKTEEHDLLYKVKNSIKFLENGDKVKVTVSFTGREVTHKEIGQDLLEKFVDAVGEIGTLEQTIRSEGRNMSLVLAPVKK
ncbi:translation initiation factor IF-3 [Deltaproteobacteria bacterium TL4]